MKRGRPVEAKACAERWRQGDVFLVEQVCGGNEKFFDLLYIICNKFRSNDI